MLKSKYIFSGSLGRYRERRFHPFSKGLSFWLQFSYPVKNTIHKNTQLSSVHCGTESALQGFILPHYSLSILVTYQPHQTTLCFG